MNSLINKNEISMNNKLRVFTMLVFLLPAVGVNAQYSGGNGRGDISSGIRNSFLGNFFKTDGNWSTTTNWSDGVLPGSTEAANIAAAAEVDGNYSHPSMTISSAGSVSVSSGKSLTITGTLTNNNEAGGLFVKSGGSLIQYSANVSAYVERDIASWGIGPLSDHGWHFLSSPVSALEIDPAFTDPTSANYDFYAWWEATNEWVNFKNTTVVPVWNTANVLGATSGLGNFIAGKGYLVEYATDAIGVDAKQFSGTLNKDNITVSNLAISSGINRGWHLLGNPFSSALKWNDGNWALSNITATAKIWNEVNASYSDVPSNGYIPALNGFMVEVTAGFSGNNSITIPAASRVHNTTEWYKSSGNPSIVLVANDPVRQTAQESIIRFTNEATTGFDSDFDSHFLAGYAPQFYSVAGNEMLSTNALPESGGSVQVPFDFIKNENVNFTIEAKTIEAIEGPVILNDLKTGASQDITVNPVYSFTSAVGDNPNRFLLKFSNVGIDETGKINPFTVFASNHEIFVIGDTGNNQGNVLVYNLTGQLMAQQRLSNSAQTKIGCSPITGYYIVKVVTNENAYSSKVFVK